MIGAGIGRAEISSLTFQLGDDAVGRRAGALAFVSRGIPHTYANLSIEAASANRQNVPAGAA
jgi:hypothetical protein